MSTKTRTGVPAEVLAVTLYQRILQAPGTLTNQDLAEQLGEPVMRVGRVLGKLELAELIARGPGRMWVSQPKKAEE